MATVAGGSFASPSADAQTVFFTSNEPLLSRVLSNITPWNILLSIVLCCITYDQCSYLWSKGSIPGPSWKAPFIGPFLQSMNPKFWEYQAKWASGELSCVSIFHKFVVIASTRDMARKVFNSPNFVKPCVVDNAYKLLRPQNWVFLDGKAHVDYRKGLNGLFTRQALEMYLPMQEEVYDDYFERFVKITEHNKGKPFPFMPTFREVQCALALRTFVGYYISDAAIKKIADDYYNVTAALELVNFPFILPFSKSWYGKRAADMILDEFLKCSAKSKVKMAAGGEPCCILDQWVKQIQASEIYRQKLAKGIEADKPAQVLRSFTDFEIAMTLFTFLFASQDATSSACTWLFQLMADNPEMLDRIRAEQLRVRDGDRFARFSMDRLDRMPYTRAVVKETLRYRPPVIMVPYKAKKDFPITPTYTAPKGSMVIPTVYPATHDPDAYPNPETFDPERWITGDAEKQVKNWLVFGTGPHYCLGQTYAQNNLIAMIGKASLMLDWEHSVTDKSEDIKVFATIFPVDDCHLTFKKREE